MKKNNIISDLVKEIPLKTRLKVSIEMAFINLITELGYREDKMWTEEENETLDKLLSLAEKLSEECLEDIREWEEDGKPI